MIQRKMTTVFVLVCILAAVHFENVNCAGLNVEFSWNKLNYDIPASSNSDLLFPDNLNTDSADETFASENNVPMGANRWRNKLFITVPRRRPGIPSTLNYVSLGQNQRTNVPLIPYPNLSINTLSFANFSNDDVQTPFVSVYRTAVDVCNRLWFVDTGLLEYPNNQRRVRPMSIVIIDLLTDKVLRRYPLKQSDVVNNSLGAAITIDVTAQTCDDAFAYIPDLSGYGLIVYSWRQQNSWRLRHNYFYLDPFGGEMNIAGLQFQWNDGIFSIELSETKRDGYRLAYFHPMASTYEFTVSTEILKNQSLAERSYHGQDLKSLGSRGENTQSSMHALHHKTGILFYAYVNQDTVACWNTRKRFSRSNHDIVHQDHNQMVYPSDIKIDQEDNIWMLSNTMPRFIYSHLNYQDVNFRVWSGPVGRAVSETSCAEHRKGGSSGSYH